jgi:hypothetical protein
MAFKNQKAKILGHNYISILDTLYLLFWVKLFYSLGMKIKSKKISKAEIKF